MTTYKVGDVAVATVKGHHNVRLMAGEGTHEPKLRWQTTDNRVCDPTNEGWFFDIDASGVRPLLVIDPHDREQVARLGRAYYAAEARSPVGTGVTEVMQEALLRYAKPDEPLGMGAVVEDAACRVWIRADASGSPWLSRYGGNLNQRQWDQIDVVEILSEGVTR